MTKRAQMFSIIGMTQYQLRLTQAVLKFAEQLPEGGDIIYSVIETSERSVDHSAPPDLVLGAEGRSTTGVRTQLQQPSTIEVLPRAHVNHR